jgi:hypothetical protein
MLASLLPLYTVESSERWKMNIVRDISNVLQRAVAGLAFNVTLVASIAVVGGKSPWPISLAVVGFGLAAAAVVFAALSRGTLQRVKGTAF